MNPPAQANATPPRRRASLVPCLLLFVLLASPLAADAVHLRSGVVVPCKVLEETDGIVRIRTGTVTMEIEREQIERIDRGFVKDYLLDVGRQALAKGERLLRAGQREEAMRAIEAAEMELRSAMQTVSEQPPELVELLDRLHVIYLRSLPEDPQARRAQQLYHQAHEAIDHLDYEQAFGLLDEAADLQPGRLDIQVLLAEMARNLGENQRALEAYNLVLEQDATRYYPRVAAPMLDLLERYAGAQLAERRTEEAVESYKDILLLREEASAAPVRLEVFLERREKRAQTDEATVLREVYRHADSNDLVDLAFVALERVRRLEPDNPELQRLSRQTRLMADFKRRVDEGDIEAAARLRREADPELLTEELDARLEKLAGEQIETIESVNRAQLAATALERLRQLMDRARYEQALPAARELIAEYGDMPEAAEAGELLKRAEAELGIQQDLREAETLVAQRRYDQATQALQALRTRALAAQSAQLPRIDRLIERIPREQNAEDLWQLAQRAIEEERLEEASRQLERLVREYGETRPGRRAQRWLNNYKRSLLERQYEKKLIDTGLFANLTNPALWRVPEPTERGRGKVKPVAGGERGRARQAFDLLMVEDTRFHTNSRPMWLNILLPLLLGLALSYLLLHRFWGLSLPWSDKSKHSAPSGPGYRSCRACGQQVPEEDAECQHCGASRDMTESESTRQAEGQRWGDYDPWDHRTAKPLANDYPKYMAEAEKLLEQNRSAEAVEACRKALREDPHRKDGYKLLASLYEELGRKQEAQRCYHEIFLIDPTDKASLKFHGEGICPPRDPVDWGRLPHALAAALWWMLYWVAVGVDPGNWLLRLILAAAGFGLTLLLMQRLNGKLSILVGAAEHQGADVDHPLPEGPRKISEQDKQARHLAEHISEHTMTPVPAMTSLRGYIALALGILLLFALIYAAWVFHASWILLAWPAGLFLFYYYWEIHPRVLTAYVLLRHLYSETNSPWADPHHPFRPRQAPRKPEAEFLVTHPRQLPLRWALHPLPWPATRQGVLNSLQQFFNRHWACHRFYNNMRVISGYRLSMPPGLKLIPLAALLLTLMLLAHTLSGQLRQGAFHRDYRDSMRIAYSYFLDGDLPAAARHLNHAVLLRPERVAPRLYLGHIQAARGLLIDAERQFDLAIRKGPTMQAPLNDYANFLQRQGRLEDSMTFYEKALELDADNANILNNLGSAAFKLRRHAKAEEYLRRAVRLEPRHPRAHTTLGLVLEAQQRHAEARDAFRMAISVAPREAYTRVAQTRIEQSPATEEQTLGLDSVESFAQEPLQSLPLETDTPDEQAPWQLDRPSTPTRADDRPTSPPAQNEELPSESAISDDQPTAQAL